MDFPQIDLWTHEIYNYMLNLRMRPTHVGVEFGEILMKDGYFIFRRLGFQDVNPTMEILSSHFTLYLRGLTLGGSHCP